MVKGYTVGAQRRLTIWVDQEDAQLADTAVSTTLTVTGGGAVIAERAMWWAGLAPPGSWYAAHTSAGATATGTQWVLAEGEEGGAGARATFILVANTSAFAGAAEVTLVGPQGALHLPAGIRATRHIHLNPTEAAYYSVEPGQLVRVRIPGPHAVTFENVLVRVSPNVIAQMHLHTDDANSAGLRGGEGIELILC